MQPFAVRFIQAVQVRCVGGQPSTLLYDPIFSSGLTTSSVHLKLCMPGACIFREFFWGSCFWNKFAVFRKMGYFRGGKKHVLAKEKKPMLWLNLYTGLCTNRKIIRKLEITEEK